MYHPLVSIIIPVYNGSNYMKIAIDSALAQTYDNLEIIVVNDGSRDEGKTDAIAKSYGDKIRYFSKPNGGVATALNLAISNMNGEWFSWLSHDDVYLPDKIQHEIDLLNKCIEKDSTLDLQKCVVYCGSESINSAGVTILRRKYKPVERRDTRDILMNMPYMHVGGCTMMIPKTVFDRIGMFLPERTNVQDKDLVYKLYLNRYSFLFVNEYLVQSRRHKEQTGNKVKKTWQTEIDDLNCDFIDQSVLMEDIVDSEVMCEMLICFLRSNSKPAVARLESLLKQRLDPIEYAFCVVPRVAYWKCYGIGRGMVRFVYRKVLAGQH